MSRWVLLLVLTALVLISIGWHVSEAVQYREARKAQPDLREVAAVMQSIESGDICRQCCAGGHPRTPVDWRLQGRPDGWLIAGEQQ